MHERRIRSERIGYNFNGRIGEQKHTPDVAGAFAWPVHFYRPVVAEKSQNKEKGKEHQDNFQHKNSRAISQVACGVCNGDTKRKTLQHSQGDRALSYKAAVEKSA